MISARRGFGAFLLCLMGTGLLVVGLALTGYAAALLTDPNLSCHRVFGPGVCASDSFPLSAAQRDQVAAQARMLLAVGALVAVGSVVAMAATARTVRRVMAEDPTAEIPDRPTLTDVGLAVIAVALGSLALAGGFHALISSVLPTCQGAVLEAAAACPTTEKYGLPSSKTFAELQGSDRMLSAVGLAFGVLLTGTGLLFAYWMIDDIRVRSRHRNAHTAPPSPGPWY
ncbi:hypothetical protein ACFVVM_34180 [Nocardia sp. NPDC058176]|uniref:hypothetical protein n=1 Tax=Nocardia sp. NPDC058176 TaxID=3346368 RepID=UPI0036DC442D